MCLHSYEGMSGRYLWRFVVHSPASFGKLFHVFEYLMFHFQRQAGKLLRVDIYRVGVFICFSPLRQSERSDFRHHHPSVHSGKVRCVIT